MVKFFVLVLFVLHSLVYAEFEENPLTKKVTNLIGEGSYEQNKAFIKLIFTPEEKFYLNERIDVVKVAQTLKENGLLNLFFKKPQTFQLRFTSNVSPTLLVKIMGDTLRNIGYFRYVTLASSYDNSAFSWSVEIRSEYATDPLILQKELQKYGSKIIDIQRDSQTQWSYTIDMNHASLPLVNLINGEKLQLKRSLYAHWLDVSQVKSLTITSSPRNRWYPYIAFYDSSFHLIELQKAQEVKRRLSLAIPKDAKYIKISDHYSLKNIRDGLSVVPKGER